MDIEAHVQPVSLDVNSVYHLTECEVGVHLRKVGLARSEH